MDNRNKANHCSPIIQGKVMAPDSSSINKLDSQFSYHWIRNCPSPKKKFYFRL